MSDAPEALAHQLPPAMPPDVIEGMRRGDAAARALNGIFGLIVSRACAASHMARSNMAACSPGRDFHLCMASPR